MEVSRDREHIGGEGVEKVTRKRGRESQKPEWATGYREACEWSDRKKTVTTTHTKAGNTRLHTFLATDITSQNATIIII